MQTRHHISRSVAGWGLLLAALALVLYGVVPQVSGLRTSWHLVAHANGATLLLAGVFLTLTLIISAVTYQLLALHPLRFKPTLLVQIAGGFAGKILPAGLGSIGLNATYLRRQRHSLREALAVVGANNVTGFIGYLAVLAVAVPLLRVHWPSVHVPAQTVYIVAGSIGLATLVVVLVFGRRTWRSLGLTMEGLQTYRRHPLRLIAVLLLARVTPALFAGVVWCSAQALGFQVSLAAAFAAFSASLLVGSVTPTPGGILGAEAGLIGALVAYGFTAHDALIVALLYRFITYWLPMLPGGFMLIAIRGRLTA